MPNTAFLEAKQIGVVGVALAASASGIYCAATGISGYREDDSASNAGAVILY